MSAPSAFSMVFAQSPSIVSFLNSISTFKIFAKPKNYNGDNFATSATNSVNPFSLFISPIRPPFPIASLTPICQPINGFCFSHKKLRRPQIPALAFTTLFKVFRRRKIGNYHLMPSCRVSNCGQDAFSINCRNVINIIRFVPFSVNLICDFRIL